MVTASSEQPTRQKTSLDEAHTTTTRGVVAWSVDTWPPAPSRLQPSAGQADRLRHQGKQAMSSAPWAGSGQRALAMQRRACCDTAFAGRLMATAQPGSRE